MKLYFSSLLASSLLFFGTQVDAAVYKHIADDGSVFYSDKPLKGEDTKYESDKIMEFKATTPKPSTPPDSANQEPAGNRTRHLGGTSDEVPGVAPKADTYQSISFSALEDGSSIRTNDGNVTVQVSLTPALQTAFKHKLVFVMDGSQSQQSTGASATFQNVDRGAHQFSAQVHDENGNTLLQTGPITLYIQRFSAIRANKAH